VIPILTYHQIATPPASPSPFRSLSVPLAHFESQMGWLKRLGYQGLSMRDLMPYLRGEREGRVVGITFDDGYQNNLLHALPVLQRVGFTATVYAVSQRLGQSNTWDQALGVPVSALMTRQELQEWSHAGLEVGSHTRNHVRLTHCTEQEAQREIAGSKAELEDLLGCAVSQFCYPYGEFNASLSRRVDEAGYEAATTTLRSRERGGERAREEWFTLSRVPVVRSTHWPQFLLKILTRYEDQHAHASEREQQVGAG
jgi:peptidoglycan/xylan/chitin deacetylase (PgdA/CDA1 family)